MSPKLKRSPQELATFYRLLSNSNGEFDVKNYLGIFQNFVDQASNGFWYLENQEKNYESISPVIRNLIYDVSQQNPTELRNVKVILKIV